MLQNNYLYLTTDTFTVFLCPDNTVIYSTAYKYIQAIITQMSQI
jgi:hypothetical protein